MSRLKRAATAAAILFIAGCTGDAGTVLGPSGGPQQTISDAAHAGAVPGFYFLPPMVPSPSFSGTFDAALQPRVEICELSGASCGTVIANFTMANGVQVSPTSQHYSVSWHTGSYNLDPAKHYRISVYVDSLRLGFADVDVVGSGKELKNVDTQQFIPLLDDRTLPIKFRIETGIVAQVVVSPPADTVNVGGTAQFTATLIDLHGNPVSGPTVTWSSSNTAVATVDASGLATGVAPGTVTITASIGYQSGTATLTVEQPNEPPVAHADSFEAIGNVTVPVSAPGVLANDTDPEGDALQAVAGTFTTTGGGTVVLAADGSLTYLSAPGFTGVDSVQYQVTDGIDTSAAATVTFSVATRVWYADNAAAAPGDGRDASPFATLAQAEAASAAGETVFLLYGNGTSAGYDAGFTFKPGQALTGQGVPSSVTVTLNGQSVTLLEAGNAPTVTRASVGPTIQLATNSTLQGLDVESTAGAGIDGSGFGTFAAVAVNVAAVGGPALDLQNGNVGASFGTLSSTGSVGAGLRLHNLVGTLSGADGSIVGAAGAGIDIAGGNGSISVGSDVSGAVTRAASVTGRTGGSVTLSGDIADAAGGILVQNNSGGTIAFTGASKSLSTGANNGVTLASNSGATIQFAGGGLAIATTTGTGFSATGGGTVTVTGAGNDVTSAGGPAVSVQNTTIGAAGLTFRSVSANGGANGIVLSGTGALNGLQVTGDGSTAGSGGTIQAVTGDGVSASGATGIQLAFVRITGAGESGVALSGVSGFVLNGTLISAPGDHGVHASGGSAFSVLGGSRIENAGNSNDEYGIFLDNVTGTAVIDNSTVFNSRDDLVHVVNSGTSLVLSVRNGSVLEYAPSRSPADFANAGVAAVPNGSASITVDVRNSTLRNIVGNGVLLSASAAGSSGTSALTFVSNQVTSTAAGKSGAVAAIGRFSTTTVVDVADNVFTNVGGVGLVVVDSKNTAVVRGTIARNSISDAGAAGIVVNVDDGATSRVVLDGNDIRRVGSDGIQAANFGGAGTSTLDLVVTNNRVDTHSTSPLAAFLGGIVVFSFEDSTCLALTGNTVANTPAGFEDVYLEQSAGSFTYEEVPNTAAAGTVSPAFIQGQNSVSSASVGGAVVLSNGVSCARP